MKVRGCASVILVWLALGSPGGVRGETAASSQEQVLTKAKLDADLGRYEVAAAGLLGLIADPEAPPALRAEALVRLGAARQSAGDAKGSLEAFSRALREHGDDEAAIALLVQAVGAVAPAADLWQDRWRRLQLGVDVTHPDRPTAWIRWPEAPWGQRRRLDASEGRVVRFVRAKDLYSGAPISLHFEDGNLHDVFRLFADISGLNVVVNPGTKGRVNCRFANVPWDDALDRFLSANGLASRLNGPVLHIGRAEDLGPPDQKFTGRLIDVDFRDMDLVEGFRTVAERGGLRAEVGARVGGRLTLKLNQVPWDQAFDIIARVNGLRWKRTAGSIAVGFPGEVGR